MSKEASFAIFCLESYKNHAGINGAEAARLFRQYDVYGYLREFYDVLHTTGDAYINHDIDRYIRNRIGQNAGNGEVSPMSKGSKNL